MEGSRKESRLKAGKEKGWLNGRVRSRAATPQHAVRSGLLIPGAGRKPGTPEVQSVLRKDCGAGRRSPWGRGPAVSQFLPCRARGASEAAFPSSLQSANHLKNPKGKIHDGEIPPVLAARLDRSCWRRHSTK